MHTAYEAEEASVETPDVLAFLRVRNGYPTEKPVELSKVLIEQSSSPGQIVAGPFMGSIGVAALETATARFAARESAFEGPATRPTRAVGDVTRTGVLTDSTERES